jgi:hypothetical protein
MHSSVSEMIVMPTGESNHDARKDQKSASADVPPMPAVKHPLVTYVDPVAHDEKSHSGIGYRCWPAKKGGPAFAVYRRSSWDNYKVVSELYPPTEEGWTKAWQEYASINPEGAERVRRALAPQGKNGNTLAFMGNVTFLGGYTPSAEIKPHSSYDLRFMRNHLAVLFRGGVRAAAELPYSDFIDMRVTGPGLIKSVNPLVGPLEKMAGIAVRAIQPGVNANLLAAEGEAISAALNTAGTHTKIQTVLFMQTADSELFFLCGNIKPDELRIHLSPAFGRIREILGPAEIVRQNDADPGNSSVVSELDKAATLLDRGLITREEFDQLKARLITGS